jgi:hypothetical protein
MEPPDRRERLLQPTLSASSQAIPLYSVQAFFLCAFFGGPFAALAFWSVNARRAGRLQADAPLIATVAVLFVAGLWFLMRAVPSDEPAPSWLRLGIRLAAIGLVGIAYLRYRERYRAMTVAGIDSPNGAIVAIGCALAGAAVSFAILALVRP